MFKMAVFQQQIPPFGQIYEPNCDFDQFLFFDVIHPTAVTHARAAHALESVIPAVDID